MRHPTGLLGAAFVLGAVLALATACTGGQPTSSPAPRATAAATVTPTAAADVGTGTGSEPSPGDEPLDLVVLAASGGSGVAERYAPLLAEASGREVRNHGHLWVRPTGVLSGAESGADVVAGAEVILMYFPPVDYEPPGFLPCLEAVDPEGDGISGAPTATSVEDWQAWRNVLDQEYEAIWTLREGQPTLIVGYGGWNPWLAAWRQAGIEAECASALDALDVVEREAAEAHGAMHVSTLDVFNGPKHDQDPADQGWIADDGMHASESGEDRLVEALVAAGFEAGQPPG
jgi:hypothetical protein